MDERHRSLRVILGKNEMIPENRPPHFGVDALGFRAPNGSRGRSFFWGKSSIPRLPRAFGASFRIGDIPFGVTVLLRGQEIAIGRLGADASQNRLSAVEKLIVQPGANARQILRAVDHASLLRGCVEHVVNGADADRPPSLACSVAQQVAHEFDNAELRTAAHQRQCDDHLAHPSLGDLYLE
jgi:hypothetical protein